MITLHYGTQIKIETDYGVISDPKELTFTRVFDLMEWVKKLKSKSPYFLVLGEKSETCRTYIAENTNQVQRCIRYWPSQTTYAIFEYDNMMDCYMLAKDYREQCGFKTSIAQSLK